MRSLAQWSRASEVVFSKRRGDVRGGVRNMCFFEGSFSMSLGSGFSG